MVKKKSRKTKSYIIKFLVSNVDFRNTVDNFGQLDKVKQLNIKKLKETNLKGWQRIFCKRKKTNLKGWHKYHFKINKPKQENKKLENEKKQTTKSNKQKDLFTKMGEKLRDELKKDAQDKYIVTNDEIFLINEKSLDIIYSQIDFEKTPEHTNRICRLFVHFGGNIENVVLEILDSSIQLKEHKERENYFNSLDEVHRKLYNVREICDEKDVIFKNYLQSTKNQQAEYEANMPDDCVSEEEDESK